MCQKADRSGKGAEAGKKKPQTKHLGPQDTVQAKSYIKYFTIEMFPFFKVTKNILSSHPRNSDKQQRKKADQACI